ncbi:MAG: hypothetical protein HXY47_03145 [Nitrospirae bacterium]|jgi:hypothetical protein|nr:hypothetical protein [Nitrospirota bacterium]
MKKLEAEKVIKIILEADGGCKFCVASLLKLYGDEFPEYKENANMAFRDKFEIGLEEFLNESHKEHIRGN